MIGYANTEAQKNLIAFMFSTGGRVSEVLQLTTNMFHVMKDAKPPILIVQGMPLKKKYKKTGEYVECSNCHYKNAKGSVDCEKCGENLLKNGKRRFITDRLNKTRKEFVIRTDEPLAKIVIHTIIKRIEEEEPCIFKSPYTGRLYTRQWAYKVLRRIGKRIGTYLYPHRLRSERACHLASSLKAESLLEWFSWEDWKTAKRYAKKGALGLAREMGVEIPRKVD